MLKGPQMLQWCTNTQALQLTVFSTELGPVCRLECIWGWHFGLVVHTQFYQTPPNEELSMKVMTDCLL